LVGCNDWVFNRRARRAQRRAQVHAPKHGNSETPAGSGGAGLLRRVVSRRKERVEGREEGSVFRIKGVFLMARGGVRVPF
jgi:hypothetical protein